MVALEEALRLRREAKAAASAGAPAPAKAKTGAQAPGKTGAQAPGKTGAEAPGRTIKAARKHLSFKTATAPGDPRSFAATQVAPGDYKWLREQQAREFAKLKAYLASAECRRSLDAEARAALHKRMQRLASSLNRAKQRS